MTTTDSTSPTQRRRPAAGAIGAMYAGLALTVVAIIAPYVDRATGHVLADHIRDGYPTSPKPASTPLLPPGW
jgi:hypothetical protein